MSILLGKGAMELGYAEIANLVLHGTMLAHRDDARKMAEKCLEDCAVSPECLREAERFVLAGRILKGIVK